MKVSKKLLLALSVSVITIFALCASVSAASEKIGIVTGNVVNFRKEPDLSSKVLFQLNEGTIVTVVDSKGDWYRVVYNDAYGWMHRDWLQVRGKSIATGIVTGTVVNVRSKPTTGSEVIAQYKKGAKVEIFEKSGGWYRVSVGEERYGWMSSDWVRIKEETVSRGNTQTDRPDAGNKGTEASDPGSSDIEEAQEAGNKASESVETADSAGGTEETDDGSENADAADNESGAGSGEDIVDRQALVEYAKTLLGIKYVYGGETEKGFDCSGFVKYVYNHFGISIERTSSSQAKGGRKVKKSELKPGDLVFFDTVDDGVLNDISHVGIYIGDGNFIHASTYLKKKITIESLSSSYYSKRYMTARDYISK